MASVTELVDYVCRVTGINAATAAERTRVLGYLRDAYQQAIEESRARVRKLAVTVTSDELTLAQLGAGDLLFLLELRIDGQELQRVSLSEFGALQAGQLSSAGGCYCMPDPQTLLLWPAPSKPTQLSGWYAAEGLTLVESSPQAGVSEVVPSAFPARFHRAVLANLAIALATAAEQREPQQVAWYRELYDAELGRLIAWVNKAGGRNLPTRRG